MGEVGSSKQVPDFKRHPDIFLRHCVTRSSALALATSLVILPILLAPLSSDSEQRKQNLYHLKG